MDAHEAQQPSAASLADAHSGLKEISLEAVESGATPSTRERLGELFAARGGNATNANVHEAHAVSGPVAAASDPALVRMLARLESKLDDVASERDRAVAEKQQLAELVREQSAQLRAVQAAAAASDEEVLKLRRALDAQQTDAEFGHAPMKTLRMSAANARASMTAR